MSSSSLGAAAGNPVGRYDRVEAAYEGMNEANRESFRRIIADEGYTHIQVARALQEIGYDIDRKQVHNFREKLAMRRVTL